MESSSLGEAQRHKLQRVTDAFRLTRPLQARGKMRDLMGSNLPYVVGYDFAGVVDSVGHLVRAGSAVKSWLWR